MTTDPSPDANDEEIEQSASARIRLPGFFTEDEVGLGTLLKRVTSAAGVQPCDECEKRAAALNRWIVFTRINQ
jgi:hypothetical protein